MSANIWGEIGEANTILASATLTSAQKTRLNQIAGDLDLFNNGATGNPVNSAHCE